MKDLIVVVDLGGTSIRTALCDAEGNVRARNSCDTIAPEGPEAVFARILQIMRNIAGDWTRVRGMGLGAPGPVDPSRGIILHAPNLPGMNEFPMKARLEGEFRVPALVGNDANLAALGEHRFGAGRGVANMIYITISTGIGGGIIVEDKLFLGSRGFAGEIGHQTLAADEPRCICGNVGCLEVLASGTAIARDARDEIKAGRSSKIRVLVNDNLERISAREVTEAARQGDSLALEILERAGFYVGLGIVNLLHMFDTQVFVLGGSVAIHAWDLFFPHLMKTFHEHAMPAMREDVRIVSAALGDDAGLRGAAAMVLGEFPNS